MAPESIGISDLLKKRSDLIYTAMKCSYLSRVIKLSTILWFPYLFDDGGGDGVLDMDLRLLAKDVLHPERDLLRFLKGEIGGGSPIDRSMALCRIFAICVSMRGVGFSRHSASLARVTASHSSSNLKKSWNYINLSYSHLGCFYTLQFIDPVRKNLRSGKLAHKYCSHYLLYTLT